MSKKLLAVLTATICGVSMAQAPMTIERVKLTDNDLSCQQVYQEITLMDSVMARAAQPTAPVAQAAAPVTDTTGQQVAVGIAGAVAQQAIAQNAARTGFGGFGGGAGGLFGSLLGGAAQVQAQQAQAQQMQQAQQAQMAAAQANQASQQNAALGQQAQARKDHLTQVFLAKGCKMSEIKK